MPIVTIQALDAFTIGKFHAKAVAHRDVPEFHGATRPADAQNFTKAVQIAREGSALDRAWLQIDDTAQKQDRLGYARDSNTATAALPRCLVDAAIVNGVNRDSSLDEPVRVRPPVKDPPETGGLRRHFVHRVFISGREDNWDRALALRHRGQPGNSRESEDLAC